MINSNSSNNNLKKGITRFMKTGILKFEKGSFRSGCRGEAKWLQSLKINL